MTHALARDGGALTLDDAASHLLSERGDERVLVLEVVMHQRLAHAGASGDVPHAQLRGATFSDECPGGVEDAACGRRALLRTWRGHRAKVCGVDIHAT